MPNKDIAGVLAVFPTGWFGVHHFYLGNKIRGVLYLLFFWTVLPIVLALWDGIKLWRYDDETFIKKYGTEEELHELYLERLRQAGMIPPKHMMNPELMAKMNQGEFDEDMKDMNGNPMMWQAAMQQDQQQQENEEVSQDSKKTDESTTEIPEPDYSNYYGPWGNENETSEDESED